MSRQLPYIFANKQDIYPQRATLVIPVGSPKVRTEDIYSSQTLSTRSSKFSPRMHQPSMPSMTSFSNLTEAEYQTPIYVKREASGSMNSFADSSTQYPQQSLLTPRQVNVPVQNARMPNEYGLGPADLSYRRPTFAENKLMPLVTQTTSKPRQSQFYIQIPNQGSSPYAPTTFVAPHTTRPPTLLSLSPQTFESKFEERLDRQQKLLGSLFNRVQQQVAVEKHERSASLGMNVREVPANAVLKMQSSRRPTQNEILLNDQESLNQGYQIHKRSSSKKSSGSVYDKTIGTITRIEEEEENSDLSRLNSKQQSRNNPGAEDRTPKNRRTKTIVSFRPQLQQQPDDFSSYYNQRELVSSVYYDDPSPQSAYLPQKNVDSFNGNMYYQGTQPYSVNTMTALESDEDRPAIKRKSFARRASKKMSRKSCIIKPEDSRLQKRIQVKKKLRMVGWTLAYYFLLYNKTKKKVLLEKDLSLVTASQNLSFITSSLEFYITHAAGKEIQAMVTDKKHSYIFCSEKVTNGKIDKPCQALFNHCKTIFTKLSEAANTISTVVFDKLASISEEGSILPHDYFSDYELKRQQFSYFGKLKYVTPAKSKILITGMVIRVLLKNIIMKPSETFRIDPKKINNEKLLNIGSLIYNVLMEVLAKLGPAFKDNQKFLCIELNTKPKKTLPKAIELDEESAIPKPTKDSTRDGEIIEGFYSKQQLSCFFKDRANMIDDLKDLVYKWVDYIYEMSHARALKANK